jgi:hypothetical protein
VSLPTEALLLAAVPVAVIALLAPELVAVLRAVRAPAPTAGPGAKVIPFRPRQEVDRAS